MKRYEGRFRVIGEMYYDNKDDKVKISSFNYIKCYKGFQIYRYDRTKLVLQTNNTTSFNARRRLLRSKGIWFEDWGYDDGGDIIFKEKDLDDILKLKVGKSAFVKPVTNGKNIKWNSKKNIPKKYKDNPQLFVSEIGGY